MNIERIDMLGIPVTDQAASLAFYTEKLGFEVRQDIPHMEDSSTRWIELAPPGGATRIVLNTWVKTGSFIPMVLITSNIEADYVELQGKGVNMTPLERQPWGISTMITDPDGNELVLQQNTDFPEEAAARE